MVAEHRFPRFQGPVAALPLIAFWAACLGACSGDASSSGTNATGGNTTSTASGIGGGGTDASNTTGSTTSGVADSTAMGTVGTTTGSGGTSTASTTGSASTTDGMGGATAAGTVGAGGASTSAGGVSGVGGGASGGSAGTGGGAGGVGGTSTTGTNSPGCGTALSRPDPNVQQTMEIGGDTRYYLLNVPENADNETPLMLIFALHGYDMNNVAVVGLYNFTERSNGQAITVLPQGEGPPPGDVSHWGDGVLQSTWNASDTNYDYIQALMTDLGERYCVDTSRVFITGFSMGGFFTNSIACAHSDWFRGFAPVAGGGPTSCADDVMSAIMIHHGTTDDIVDISSGEESRDIWLGQNGCSMSSSSSYMGCETYDGCPDGKPVVWCVGNWNHTISSTAASNIWSFFSGLE